MTPFRYLSTLCLAVSAAIAASLVLVILVGQDAARLIGLAGGGILSFVVLYWCWGPGLERQLAEAETARGQVRTDPDTSPPGEGV